jgi:hypothetical protein
MNFNLSDIEEISLKCRSEQSRDYIAESIKCYKAGAHRASIVNTWIAIVFDLIDKIRELSLSGDNVAKDLEIKYESYIKQIEEGNGQGIKCALEFERNILDTCKNKLQFFDRQQFVDLCRLREDRHRCAHPSFQKIGEPYNPSAEQARLHLRNAIVYVLSQPPVQGKAALVELITMVSSSYFPTEKAPVLTLLKSSALSSAQDSLVRNFIDKLIFGFFEDANLLYAKPQALSAIEACYEMYPDITETRLRKQMCKISNELSDEKYKYFVASIALLPFSWSLIESASKNKIIQYIQKSPGSEVIKIIKRLSNIPELKDHISDRINELSQTDITNAISKHNIGELAINAAIRFLSNSRSFDKTNEIFDNIIMPLFEKLSKPIFQEIICLPTTSSADMIGATSYKRFIEKLRSKNIFSDEELNNLLDENLAHYLVVPPSSKGNTDIVATYSGES